MKKLYKSKTDSKISGVCGGIATYFGIDSTIVRVIFVVLLFYLGFVPPIIAYIVVSCIMPEDNNIIEN